MKIQNKWQTGFKYLDNIYTVKKDKLHVQSSEGKYFYISKVKLSTKYKAK